MLDELKPKGPKGQETMSLVPKDLEAPPPDPFKSAVLSTEGRVVGLCWEHLKA